MRRLAAIAAILVLASQAASAATLDRTRQTGVFKVGYRTDAKPYSYRTDQGQPAGYIVDLCREVAAAVVASIGNVRAEYVVVPADQRFEAVRNGRVDMLCDPSSVTKARREMVDFSLPTFLNGASALSRSNKPVQRLEDLNGIRVGVLFGTTTEQTLRDSLAELNLKADVVSIRDHRAGMDLLSDDKVDAYFADRAIVAALLYEGGRPVFQLSKQYFTTRPMRSRYRATTARFACWSTARWHGFIAADGSTAFSPRPSATHRSTTC